MKRQNAAFYFFCFCFIGCVYIFWIIQCLLNVVTNTYQYEKDI